jgi:hypothetical protein
VISTFVETVIFVPRFSEKLVWIARQKDSANGYFEEIVNASLTSGIVFFVISVG